MQGRLPLHTLLQLPQWRGLACRSTQAPPQIDRPASHRSEQRPCVQNCRGRQARPQAPQWAGFGLQVHAQAAARGLTLAAAAGAGHAGLVGRAAAPAGAAVVVVVGQVHAGGRAAVGQPAGGQTHRRSGGRACWRPWGGTARGPARAARADRPAGGRRRRWADAAASGRGRRVAGGVVAPGRTGGGVGAAVAAVRSGRADSPAAGRSCRCHTRRRPPASGQREAGLSNGQTSSH